MRSVRTGHGWNTIVPSWAAQATWARSAGHSSSAVRPLGNVISARSTHSGTPLVGQPLLVERVARVVGPGGQLGPGDHAARPALQRGRPLLQRPQDAVADAR